MNFMMRVLIVATVCTGSLSAKFVNVDVKNASPGVATDFELVIHGTHAIRGHFDGYKTGTLKGWFGTFGVTNPGGNTQLAWDQFADGDNNVVDVGQKIHLGWETPNPHQIKDAWWTNNGERIPNSVVYMVTQNVAVFGPDIRSRFQNDFNPFPLPPLPIEIDSLKMAILDEPLPLEDLNGENPFLKGLLAPVPGFTGPTQIPPESFFDVFSSVSVPPGQTKAVVMFHTATAPGSLDTVRVFFQDTLRFDSPAPIPALSAVGFAAAGAALLLLGIAAVARKKLPRA